MVLPVVARPVLDKEEIEPADKGSGEKRFCLVHRAKIAVGPPKWIYSRHSLATRDQSGAAHGTNGSRAYWLSDIIIFGEMP
jgi:hypothetical protein